MALKLTPSGLDLLLRTVAGEGAIDFQAIQLGNGADAGESAGALSNPLLTVEIDSCTVGDIFVTLTSTFSNTDVAAGFRATELGVLAADPDNEGGTLLYAYQYTPEAESDYIPASADKVLETQMDVLVYIGDAQNVTASISESLVYASKSEFDAFAARRDNPHGVTAAQVGLGNVPNVATNDQTPTYTTPGALTALVSGEKLSAALGKLARAVLSLISHLADKNNPHGVTAKQTGAAAVSHKHSAADITSGVLGTARGGTGGATAPEGMKNLISALTALSSSELATADKLPLLDASENLGKSVTLEALAAFLSANMGGAKIETGSYVGTGTYGASNPCSLTFGFIPRLLFVSPTTKTGSSTHRYGFILDCASCKVDNSGAVAITHGFYGSNGSQISSSIYALYELRFKVDERVVSWYYSDSAGWQCNEKNIEYHYTAIG